MTDPADSPQTEAGPTKHTHRLFAWGLAVSAAYMLGLASYALHEWAQMLAMTPAEFATFLTGALAPLGVLGIVTAVIQTRGALRSADETAKLAREANDIARDALILQNRAWLQVDAFLYKEVRLEGDNDEVVRAFVGIEICNLGGMPARNIALDVHLVLLSWPYLRGRQRELSDKFRSAPPAGWVTNETQFPNQSEPLVQHLGLITKPGEIDRVRSEYKLGPDAPIPLHLGIVGCVQYRLPGSERLHQTGFAYNLCKADEPVMTCYSSNNLPLPASAFRLAIPSHGSTNID